MDQQLTYESAIKKGNIILMAFIIVFTLVLISNPAQLVERNPQCQVDPLRVSMHDKTDIIHMAEQIQLADKQLKNSTSQKLVVILDQVSAPNQQFVNNL